MHDVYARVARKSRLSRMVHYSHVYHRATAAHTYHCMHRSTQPRTDVPWYVFNITSISCVITIVTLQLYPVYTIMLARRAGSTSCYILAGRTSSMFARCLLDRVNGLLAFTRRR